MNHRRHLTKPRPEPRYHLRRERDFRHENHGRFAHFQRAAHQTDEHLRFAAARHTVEQEPTCTALQLRQHDAQRLLLRGHQDRILHRLLNQ